MEKVKSIKYMHLDASRSRDAHKQNLVRSKNLHWKKLLLESNIFYLFF